MSLPRRLSPSLVASVLVLLLATAALGRLFARSVAADHAGGVTYSGTITSSSELSVSGATISFAVSPDRSAVTTVTVTILVADERSSCEVIFSAGPSGDSIQYPGTTAGGQTYLPLPSPIQARPDGRHGFSAKSGIVEVNGVFRSAERAEGTIRFFRSRSGGGGVVGSGGLCGTPELPWTATAPPLPAQPAPAAAQAPAATVPPIAMETPAPAPPTPSATPTPMPSPASVTAPPLMSAAVYLGSTETGAVVTVTLSPERSAVTHIRISGEGTDTVIATSPCGRAFSVVAVETVTAITEGRFNVTVPDEDYEIALTGTFNGDQISGTVSWSKPGEPDCATPVVSWTTSYGSAPGD
jgi:hypothetical protein